MLCVLCTSIDSYHRSECMIAQDLNQTLKQVLLNIRDNVIKTRQRLHPGVQPLYVFAHFPLRFRWKLKRRGEAFSWEW